MWVAAQQILAIEEGVRDLVDSTSIDGEQCIFLTRFEDEGNAPSENYVYIEDGGGCATVTSLMILFVRYLWR